LGIFLINVNIYKKKEIYKVRRRLRKPITSSGEWNISGREAEGTLSFIYIYQASLIQGGQDAG